MKNKGKIGTVALILSIIGFVVAGLSPLFLGGSLRVDPETLQMNVDGLFPWLLRLVAMITIAAAFVVSIVGIVKKSNKKCAIAGLIISLLWWVAPVITIIIRAAIIG